jgi:hypothetical protein
MLILFDVQKYQLKQTAVLVDLLFQITHSTVGLSTVNLVSLISVLGVLVAIITCHYHPTPSVRICAEKHVGMMLSILTVAACLYPESTSHSFSQ